MTTDATDETKWEATTAWRELLDGMRELDQKFLAGPRAVRGEAAVAEGYRFLATILSLAFDLFVFADSGRPRFIDVNTPFRHDRRWGGDNTDAYYAFAPVDPSRAYRIRGRRGDSIYFSLTVYNEPAPGQWSNRVVGIVNDSDLTVDAAGYFEFLIGPAKPAGYEGPFITLADDSAAILTRDYQLFPAKGQRVTWEIEAIEPAAIAPQSDVATARALRTVLRWIQEMFGIIPLTVEARDDTRTTLGHNSHSGANVFATPYQIADANYGWSARDACYSFGSFALEPGEALVVTHRPPTCRFWNLTSWNQFMAAHDLDYTTVSINNGAVTPNADGTVTIVVSRELLNHPNAISTAGHDEGLLAFRWFHPDMVPEQPIVEVVSADAAPRTVS